MADPSVHPSDQQTTKALLKGGEVGAGGVEPPGPFRVRDLGRVAATCDVCLGLAGELGR
jgi:hypothetical protein